MVETGTCSECRDEDKPTMHKCTSCNEWCHNISSKNVTEIDGVFERTCTRVEAAVFYWKSVGFGQSLSFKI